MAFSAPTGARKRARPQARRSAAEVIETKKAREVIEILLNQKDGTQIAPRRFPLRDLSVCGEVGDLTAVSDGYGKSDAHLPAFFRCPNHSHG